MVCPKAHAGCVRTTFKLNSLLYLILDPLPQWAALTPDFDPNSFLQVDCKNRVIVEAAAQIPAAEIPDKNTVPRPCHRFYRPCPTVRSCSGCKGRVEFGKARSKRAICAEDTEVGVFRSIHRTPSRHGGWVREPM